MIFDIHKSFLREKLFGWRYKFNTKYWWIWQLKKNGCITTFSPGSTKTVKRMLDEYGRVIWVDIDNIYFSLDGNGWKGFYYKRDGVAKILKFIRNW